MFDWRIDNAGVASELAHELSGRADADQLSIHIHTTEARDVAEHSRRGRSRRVAAADGLDCGARRTRRRGLELVRDSVFLANPAFSRDRMALSRRIRQS